MMTDSDSGKTTFVDSISDPKHPIWKALTTLVVMGCLTFVLWSNANDFDETEIRSLLEMGFIFIGLETVRQKVGV